jgi:hypothetical protein
MQNLPFYFVLKLCADIQIHDNNPGSDSGISDQLYTHISSIICLFESTTCFEQPCAHPQEDNCINTTSGIITL